MFSIIAINCLVFCFLSLMKRGIGKLRLQSAHTFEHSLEQGFPKRGKLTSYGIANAVKSNTLCVYAHIRQRQSQRLAHQLTTPGFLTDLSGNQRTCDAEQSTVLFRRVEAGLAQIRLPTLISCEFLNYSPA